MLLVENWNKGFALDLTSLEKNKSCATKAWILILYYCKIELDFKIIWIEHLIHDLPSHLINI